MDQVKSTIDATTETVKSTIKEYAGSGQEDKQQQSDEGKLPPHESREVRDQVDNIKDEHVSEMIRHQYKSDVDPGLFEQKADKASN